MLPAASFLEFDDLVAPYFQLMLSAQVKATEPLGEALPNQEIFRRLARAMGYTEPELYDSDAEVIATVLRASGFVEDFAALAAKGSVPVSAEPHIQFADLNFPTPSGRIEIASARAEADGHPRVPLPLADPRPADGRLRLLSPASTFTLNDSFANVAKLAKRAGAPTVALHPADAAARGLTVGDEVLLSNETGSLRLLPDALGRPPARRGAIAQRPLAQAGGGRGERQHAQPRPEGRHGREQLRAQRRGHGHRGPPEEPAGPEGYILFRIGVPSSRPRRIGQNLGSGRISMVRSLMALVLRRVLAWLVWSNEHVKDLEIVVVPVKNFVDHKR